MGLFSDKPYTAVTSTIERMSGRSSSAEDASDILELIETIQIAKIEGTAEAGRALRKQLKHGSAKQQTRALWLLEMLVDNGGKQMPTMLDDPALGDQVVLLARSGEKRPKAAAQSVLRGWETRDDIRLRSWTDQFRGRGVSGATASGNARRGQGGQGGHGTSGGAYGGYDDEYMSRSGRRSRSRPGAYDDEAYDAPRSPRGPSVLRGTSAARSTGRPASRSPSPINVRGASIASTLATSHTIATRLSEAVITHPEIRSSREARGYFNQAKEIRKRVINLIHKDSEEVHEFLDRLLVVNEELVASLQAYEDACKAHAQVQERETFEALEVHQPERAPPSPRRREPPRREPPRRERSVSRSPSPSRQSASPPRARSPPRSPARDDDPFADDNEADDVNLQRPMW